MKFFVLFVLALTVSCASKKVVPPEPVKLEASVSNSPPLDNHLASPNGGVVRDESDAKVKLPPPTTGPNLNLKTIHFGYNSASLTKGNKKQLKENANWLKANPDVSIQVEGYCDGRGSPEFNLALGERRAKAVKAQLVEFGVEAKRLSIISYGVEKPIATGKTEADYAKNRRANFVPILN